MWMTREEISETLGIVPNSVRGKVKKGQIERKVVGGKNFYRIVDAGAAPAPEPEPEKEAEKEAAAPTPPPTHVPKPTEPKRKPGSFNPKQVLLDQLADMKLGRGIDAIEKGDEIDLATGEISRELDAKISMRQHKQVKEIEDALERIKYGEYGMCEDCGENIPEQRLKLFPAARFCVRCQEEADRQEKLRNEHGFRAGGWRDETDSSYSKSFDD